MILVDTSAWVEFLRDTSSAVCNRVDELLGADIAVCHADADFDVIARSTELRVDAP